MSDPDLKGLLKAKRFASIFLRDLSPKGMFEDREDDRKEE
jgi:hypothetical protein